MKTSRNFKKLAFMTMAMLGIMLVASGCGKKKELTVWDPFTGNDGNYFNSIVKKYNKTNPKLPVKAVTVPDMYTKISTVMNSHKSQNVPDLTVMHIERVSLFKSQGLVTPIDGAIKNQKQINSNNYIAQAWDAGQIGKHRYSVPLDVHSCVMYYNKKLLAKYGPHVLDDGVVTVDEMKQVGAAAKKDKIFAYPIGGENWMAFALTTDLGGSVENPQTGMPDLNTPQMRQSLDTLRSFVKAGYSQEDGDDPRQLFQTGKAVFLPDGTWYSTVIKKNKKIDWGVTNSMAYSPDKYTNWTSSHQFALLKKTRDKETMSQIGKFIEFMRKNSDDWADSGQNAASKQVYSQASYAKRPQAFLVKNQKEMDSMHIYNFINNGNAMDSLATVSRDIIYGRKSADKALAQAQKLAVSKSKDGGKK